MKNPFVYGEEVAEETFCNREEEIKELIKDIKDCQNVLIFSPRRMGKTSLIKEVLKQVENENILTVYVDLYPAITKEYFVEIFAKAIAKSLKGKIERVVDTLKKLLPYLIPKVVMKGEEGSFEFEFVIDRSRNIISMLDTLLSAPQKIATERKKTAVVVFDEFQEIANYQDEEIERKMRSVFQTHRNISYIFMGSKKHLLYELFYNPHRPFYKSCKHIPLARIPESDLFEFIGAKFEEGDIKIDKKLIEKIISLSECHPYYVQFLCHIVWDEAVEGGIVESQAIDLALDKLLKRESTAYTFLWDSLSQKQKGLLIALAQEERPDIYSNQFLSRYNLGSASSIQKALRALVEKDVLDRENSKYLIVDIFLKRWILKNI